MNNSEEQVQYIMHYNMPAVMFTADVKVKSDDQTLQYFLHGFPKSTFS